MLTRVLFDVFVQGSHVLVHLSLAASLEGALLALHGFDPVLVDNLLVGVQVLRVDARVVALVTLPGHTAVQLGFHGS